MKHIFYQTCIYLCVAIAVTFTSMKLLKTKENHYNYQRHKILAKKVNLETKYIDKYCNRYHVKPELVKAVIYVESRNNQNSTSNEGACGLMQILPSTASAILHQNVTCSELNNNLKLNLNAGIKYIKMMLMQFSGVSFALAAYNAGPSNAYRYIRLGYVPYSSNPINNVYGYSLSVIDYINKSEGYNYVNMNDKSSKFITKSKPVCATYRKYSFSYYLHKLNTNHSNT